MGLAASQARLISLQARMSDLEYEGQQINQQRQTLTNKMNEVYSQAMDMEVPTAPSKIDYQIDAYSGKIGTQAVNLKMNDQGGWVGTITTEAYTTNPKVTKLAFSGDIPKKLEDEFVINDTRTKSASINDAGKILVKTPSGEIRIAEESDFDESQENHYLKKGYDVVERSKDNKVGDYSLKSIAEMKLEKGSEFTDKALTGLQNYINERHDAEPKKFDEFDESNFRVFMDGDGNFQFVAVGGTKYDLKEDNKDSVTCLTPKLDKDAKVSVTVGDRILDNSGNITSFEIKYKDINGEECTETVNVEHSTTAYDEVKYDEAMRNYEKEKIEYDKAQNDFNHQTSIYQRQDKQLELKLTRLDNERNALNTEIDSVKKVIQDASEKGFKTFSG